MSVDGVSAVADERMHQFEKGYTTAHDAEHGAAQLIDAALAYAMQAQDKITERKGGGVGDDPEKYWPWDPKQFKRHDTAQQDLAKAGALLAAAYDVENTEKGKS